MDNKIAKRQKPPVETDVVSLARRFTKRAVMTLTGIMLNPNEPAPSRIAAAKEILVRGWGTGKERVDMVHQWDDAQLAKMARAIADARARDVLPSSDVPVQLVEVAEREPQEK